MKKKKQDYEDAYDYEDTDYDAAYDEDYDGDYEAYDDYEDYDNLDDYEGYDEEEAPRKLTLKEKIRIVSRRDMMGRGASHLVPNPHCGGGAGGIDPGPEFHDPERLCR